MRVLLWIICSIWEVIYKNMINARYLNGSKHRLLRVAYRRYKGKEKELNGQLIKKGDLIAELHLSNLALYRYNDHKSPEWALYRDAISELHLLSENIKTNNKPITALCGITLLTPAVVRLGFSVEEIRPGLWASINYVWLRFIRIAFTPKKASRLKELDTKRRPVEFWMSAEQFTERF